MAEKNPDEEDYRMLQRPEWNQRPGHRVRLQETDQDFVDIKQIMSGEILQSFQGIELPLVLGQLDGHFEVKKIEVVYSKHLMENYLLKRKQMRENNGPSYINERFLVHGTSQTSARSIARHGFNRSFTGLNGSTYGRGSYYSTILAHGASFAPAGQYTYRSLILTRVLCGRSALGKSKAKLPPLFRTNGTLYDTTVDNETAPTLYVTYQDQSSYPSYIIYFTIVK